jgi:nitrogen-specific signal transduction histidine kinase/ActR/RegA family two-component response regulator
VRNAEGEILHFVGTAEDITDQRLLEEQLRQAQKLEAIGQLAGGVAHDFNNILTIIRGFGSLLMMAKLPPDAVEATQAIIDAAERAANLTRQLLAFGRRQVMQPRNLDLNEILVGLAAMLQRIVGEDIHIELELYRGALMTRADAGMIDQVLLNLVVNARDAMPEGGKLRIETFRLDPRDVRQPFEDRPSAQQRVGLRVVDSGVGIPQEHLAHIFEPFFTTKGPGKGTGLGLATVYGIVSQHRGSIDVRSTIGVGTTIEVLLPAIEASALAAPAGAVLEVASRGEETILVVEDDRQVRSLTRRVLEQQGYRVLEAMHGPEAIRVWDREGARVDLLLTDLVMPEGMTGLDLARRLRERRSTLKVIFMSGYSPETAGRELSERERQHFIQKPAAPAELLDTVRRCLDAHG